MSTCTCQYRLICKSVTHTTARAAHAVDCTCRLPRGDTPDMPGVSARAEFQICLITACAIDIRAITRRAQLSEPNPKQALRINHLYQANIASRQA